VVHEFGHVVAAYLSGGRVTEFSVLSLPPHVRIDGDGTPAGEAFRAAAGSGLFFLIYFACISLTAVDGSLRSIGRQTASWFAFVELFGWCSTALFRSAADFPDDAQRFLKTSGVNPPVVIGVCVLIGTACYIVSRARKPGASNVAPITGLRAVKKHAAGR